MAKAVLVMDMPESCFGCNLCHIDDGEDRATCQAYETAKEVNSDIFENRSGVLFGNCRRRKKSLNYGSAKVL